MGSTEQSKVGKSEIRHLISLFIFLYGFWIVLSGRMEFKLLAIGFVTSLAATLVTRSLLKIPSNSDDGKTYFGFDLPYLNLIRYLPWLLWEIVKANIEIALVILNPKLPINPQMVRFKKPMSNPAAHVTLANSITLTPGTVTVDIRDGEYIVHALTDQAALGVVPEKGEGEIQARVGQIFGEKAFEERYAKR